MPRQMTPAECIREALIANSELEEGVPQEQQMSQLCDAVLQYLDAEGYTVVDVDKVWGFHDRLQRWLNQDSDAHRLATFDPYDDWLEVYRRLPPRRDHEGNIVFKDVLRR